MEREFHRWSTLFPLADSTKLTKLATDIREYGQQNPITLYEGKVLDGRNRYRACVLMGIEPKVVEYSSLGLDEDPLEWMVRKNIEERHLGKGQLGALGMDVLRMQADPPYTEEQLREVAALVGAGWSSIERLVAIQKKKPEVLDAVRAGFSSVAAASRDAGFQEYENAPIPGVNDFFGKGDKFREATEPLLRYLNGWKTRGFEFSHLNPKEAKLRLKQISKLEEGLKEMRADLEPRSVKTQLRH